MGDFLIDISPRNERRGNSNAIGIMSYYEDMAAKAFDHDKYILYLSRCDDWNLWAPYRSIDKNVFIAMAGRIALDPCDWERARAIEGEGGLACKAVYTRYEKEGIEGLKSLNGSYVIILSDGDRDTLYIVSDRCGMYPCFSGMTRDHGMVIGSHPDILAKYAGMKNDLDMISIAEFLMTGRISFPHTYYKNIAALDYGCIHEVNLKADRGIYESKKKYFDFPFRMDPRLKESDLAAELGSAIKKAVNRRTDRRFGRTGVSLSGGLDSRMILSSIDNREEIDAFCFYEEENLEYKTAKNIAQALDVPFIPIKRDPCYYGDHLERGVKMSAGLGNVYSNHYLGARDAIVSSGISNIVAGFYCDYLFKGYLLDKRTHPLLRTESLSDFSYERYEPLFWLQTTYLEPVRERLDSRYPREMREDGSDLARLEIEKRRMFPLSYDSESLETLIPQKVLGWYLPTIDNDIIDVYLKTPPRYKLNKSLYTQMVQSQCNKKALDIVDANTGNRVGAPHYADLLNRYKQAFVKRYTRLKKGIVLDGSWPDWQHLISSNGTIKHLWTEENAISHEVLRALFGDSPPVKEPQDCKGKYVTLFFRLLTVKIWLEQCADV